MPAEIGEMLVEERFITRQQLHEAVSHQQSTGGRVGPILVELGYVRDQDITALLSRRYGVPSVKLADCRIDPQVISLVSPATARRHRVIPLDRSGSTLTVAVADPTDLAVSDDLTFVTGCHVRVMVASETEVSEALAAHYPTGSGHLGAPSFENVWREFAAKFPVRADGEVEVLSQETAAIALPEDERDDTDAAADGREMPVVRLVNLLLVSALHQRASDIHLEPYQQEVRVRFRIDGALRAVISTSVALRDAVTSRIKIMAGLDIAEKRRPQDGRIQMRYREGGTTRQIDVRVSCLPTLFGEKLVLRLLDRSRLMLDLGKLGFEPESRHRWEEAVRRPWGLVLVTGPTGSGKTSTLYSSLTKINSPETNIVTAEDPIEFDLPGVNQVQVHDGIGLTFASAMRSFLRQDPDVILVGEIRDRETADVAVRAALTGHLVLSTLHTNDAPSTVSRLLEMGVEPFLVASSVSLVCAQRLVRRVCSHCAHPMPISEEVLVTLGFSETEAGRVRPRMGRGCVRCDDTGYRGRIGLFEVMLTTDPLRELIGRQADAGTLRQQATEDGMRSLRQSGLRKIERGLTTIDEVARETVR